MGLWDRLRFWVKGGEAVGAGEETERAGVAARSASRRESQAHQLLLSKFTTSSDATYFDKDYWATALGEPVPKAIDALAGEGLLVRASLQDAIVACYQVKELKELARALGLKVSGTKPELAQRLTTSDTEGMQRLLESRQIFVCSEQGQTIASQYLARAAHDRDIAESQVLDLVRQRKFAEAAKTVAAFEATQVFPRGLGIDWSRGDDPADNVAELEMIFEGIPKILARAGLSEIDVLRVAAVVSLLWGDAKEERWLPEEFTNQTGFNNDVAVRMFISYARHRRHVERMRGIAHTVRVSVVDDLNTCGSCRKLHGRQYQIGRVPELPYGKCTSEMGCRCCIVVAEFSGVPESGRS